MPKPNKKLCGNCFSDNAGKVCSACGYTNKRQDGNALFLQRGTRLNDSFIIGGVIGNGGFGVTYMAYDLKNEKAVAIKEYFPKTIAARKANGSVYPVEKCNEKIFAEGAEKFYREAEYVFQFNGNSNIVSVFDYFYANNTAYLAMEYLSGITLENYIKNYGTLSEAQTVYIAERLSMALVIVHSAQLLHRDISPDNIMLCRDGKVKLIDFGAARIFTAENLPKFTVIMKSGFTPIEQYASNGDFGEWTDIYSLGTVLYYALTGKIPPNPYERIAKSERLDFGEKAFDIELCGVIEKAAGVSSEERYEHASELKNGIAALKIKEEKINVPNDYDPFKFSVDDTANEAPKRNKWVKPTIFFAAEAVALAAAFILGMSVNQGVETGSPVMAPAVTETVTDIAAIDFDGKQKKLFEFDGNIPASLLKGFGGDVEITYNFEPAPDRGSRAIGLIPADSGGNYLIKYITGDYLSAQEHGWVNLEEGAESFSFTLSREGIESLGDNDFGIYNYNLILTSAEIKAGSKQNPVSYYSYAPSGDYFEPLIFEENGEKFVEIDFTGEDTKPYPTEWGGFTSWAIPKLAFDGLNFNDPDGDILVTLEIEHTDTENNLPHIFYIYECGMSPKPVYKSVILSEAKDKFGNYLIVPIYDGVSVSEDITECSFIIPKKAADDMLGGIRFGMDHLLIKKARLESVDDNADKKEAKFEK